MKMVAEGVGTAPPFLRWRAKVTLKLPITEQVNAILHESKAPAAAIREIMDRPQKRE